MLNFYSKQLLIGGKSIPVKEVDFIFDASYGPFISGTDIDLNDKEYNYPLATAESTYDMTSAFYCLNFNFAKGSSYMIWDLDLNPLIISNDTYVEYKEDKKWMTAWQKSDDAYYPARFGELLYYVKYNYLDFSTNKITTFIESFSTRSNNTKFPRTNNALTTYVGGFTFDVDSSGYYITVKKDGVDLITVGAGVGRIKNYYITVNSNIANSIITVNSGGSLSGNIITVPSLQDVTFTVSAPNYTSETFTIKQIHGNQTVNVELLKTPTVGEVITELTSASSVSKLLPAGKYELVMVGPGTKGTAYYDRSFLPDGPRYTYTTGTSGAFFDKIFTLPKNTYACTVGESSTIFGDLTLTQSIPSEYPYIVDKTISEKTGNAGATYGSDTTWPFEYVAGGSSTYNGYGKGGGITFTDYNAWTLEEPGIGYLKLIYRGDVNSEINIDDITGGNNSGIPSESQGEYGGAD